MLTKKEQPVHIPPTSKWFLARIDARILLGDRNADITLACLASALSEIDSTRFEAFSNKMMELEGSMGIDSDAVLARGTKQGVTSYFKVPTSSN